MYLRKRSKVAREAGERDQITSPARFLHVYCHRGSPADRHSGGFPSSHPDYRGVDVFEGESLLSRPPRLGRQLTRERKRITGNTCLSPCYQWECSYSCFAIMIRIVCGGREMEKGKSDRLPLLLHDGCSTRGETTAGIGAKI